MATKMPVKVLIVGASYAGLAAATNLLDLSEGRPQRFYPTETAPETSFPIEITIVDERDGYYHVIGSPLATASPSFAEKSWTRFQDVPGLQHPAITILQGSVKNVKTETKTAEISLHDPNDEDLLEVSYDYFLAASGLRRVAPVVPASLTRDNYLIETSKHIDKVREAVNKEGVVVIGGGAVGIEMAAELKLVYPDLKVRLIHSRERLMSSEPLPDDFKDKTLELLRDVGVEVITGKRVRHISELSETNGSIQLKLADGEGLPTSFVINAISHARPTGGYLPEDVLTPEGHVKITPTLHFLPRTSSSVEQDANSTQINNNDATTAIPISGPCDPYHFAAGDITSWTGIRRCGAAMHMGSFAAHNIHAHIISTPHLSTPTTAHPTYKSLTVHPPMIGLALGSTGIAYSPTEGTKSGPEVLQMMFQDDIGFGICWNYMRLGETPPSCSLEREQGVVTGKERQVEGQSAVSAVSAVMAEKGTTKLAISESIVSVSSPSDGQSPIEPSTPYNIGADEECNRHLDTGSWKVVAATENEDVENVRQGVEPLTTKTKVSPIRVVQGVEL